MGSRWTRLRVTRVVAVTLVVGGLSPIAEGKIVRIVVDERESPIADGTVDGSMGPYERLVGRVFGELDPADPRNALIQDLDLAPRTDRGSVEYVADFVLLKPIDLSRSSGVLRYDAPNRGNARGIHRLINASAKVLTQCFACSAHCPP